MAEKSARWKKKSVKCVCYGKKTKKNGKRGMKVRKDKDDSEVTGFDYGTPVEYAEPSYKIVNIGGFSSSNDFCASINSSIEFPFKKSRERYAATSVFTKNSGLFPIGTLERH